MFEQKLWNTDFNGSKTNTFAFNVNKYNINMAGIITNNVFNL